MPKHFAAVVLSLVLTLSLILLPGPSLAFYFGGVTIKDEKEMGHKFDAAIRAQLPVIDDPEVSRYVSKLLERLVKTLPPQPFQFKSTVILNNAMNAFAVPGGYVYVLTGLMMNFESEAELAGVLAHELAHVTQRHVASRLERAQYMTFGSLLLAVAGVALGGPGGGALAVGAMGAGQSAMLNYSRMDETEADQIGLQYINAAGFQPMGMVRAFKALRQKSRMQGAGNVPTYLSTHPAIGDRIAGLTARIQKLPAKFRAAREDNKNFLRVRALLWARYGDTQTALHMFRGGDGLSAMGRGIVFARQNNVNQARAAFDEAVSKSPNDPLVLREAGSFHFRKGDLNRSQTLLTTALRLAPNDYMADYYYARLLDVQGKHSEAVYHFKSVLRAVPDEAEVHEDYAKSLNNSGQRALAYIHLAYSAIYSGNKKKAEQYVNQAKPLAKTADEKRALTRMTDKYEEYKKIWKR
ncbi:MAG: M48 family metalloprotease [Desulfovibrionaceae bacterium]|nr:M48 family metalloprotease [Desulfovibrionaceae bacterium]